MKKTFAVLLTLVMLLAVTGCNVNQTVSTASSSAPAATASSGGAAAPATSTPAASSGAEVQLSFGGSSSGGVMYYMAGAFSNTVSPRVEGANITNVTTGAAVDNAIKTASGELDIAITYSSLVYEAANGIGNFENPALAATAEGLMGVGRAYDSDFYIVVFNDSGIDSIDDLNGKTVSCGQPGSGAQYIADMVLDAFGVECNREYLAFADTTYAMKEGRIHAVCQAGSPSGAVTELAETEGISIIPFTSDQIKQLQEVSPFFFPAEMKAGVYTGVDENVLLPHFRNYIIVNRDVDADVLYNVLEVAFQPDVIAELAQGHRNWEFFAEDTEAFEALGLEVHPGAKKYFEDHPDTPKGY